MTEDTQVSLFKLKFHISISLMCQRHYTWMLIKVDQMDVWLLKTLTKMICSIFSIIRFRISTNKPCWVPFLQHSIYLRVRHNWGNFSSQHIGVSKGEIQSENTLWRWTKREFDRNTVIPQYLPLWDLKDTAYDASNLLRLLYTQDTRLASYSITGIIVLQIWLLA